MSKDKQVLVHILTYIQNIEEANHRLNGSLRVLEHDAVYRLAVTNALAQIGELTKLLSEEYKQKTSERMNWRAIKCLRNLVAHEYGNLDTQTLWITIAEDIPQLKTFCLDQIQSLDADMLHKKVLEDDLEL